MTGTHNKFASSKSSPGEYLKKPPGWGRRHILAILGFSGFALSYAMRFSLSLAIVAMVHHHPHHQDTTKNLTGGVFPVSNACLPNERNSSVLNVAEISLWKNVSSVPEPSPSSSFGEDEKFSWSEAEQGVILGSFFWGYILTQIFGGWLSHRYGGKWPFGVGLLITGIFAILIPPASRYGGSNGLLLMRFIQGLAGGVTVPSMQSILSNWFPPQERGKLGSFILSGMPFGTSISLLCSGFLIHYLHWPSVFYVTGGMTILWFLLWSYFAHTSPIEDPKISEEELRFILINLNKKADETGRRRPPVPWTSVLKSLPFWSILICNVCQTWGLYTINAELPTYMKTVLHFDIKQNSVISAFPHLLTLVVSLILTNLGDNCIERKYLSIGTVRKLCTSIALWGYGAALVGVAYSGCDRVKTVALIAAAVGMNGGKFGGYLVNLIDIAPNYSSVLMGIVNTLASVPGFVAPWVAGMIINHDPSVENWRIVFLIVAGITFVGNLFYVTFASGEEQSWNRIGEEGKKSENTGNAGEKFDA